MTKILAIGNYGPADHDALTTELGATVLRDFAALDALSEGVRGAVRAVAYKDHHAFDADVMARLPGLELIANYGVGYDAIDIAAAQARGIAVTNTPGVLDEDVADLAVCMWIAACRQVMQAAGHVQSGGWRAGTALPLATKASGRKVGIVGMGRIGQAVATRLRAFGCEVHYTSRSRKPGADLVWHQSVTDMAQAVDDLIITIVGGPETQGHVGADALAALGQGYIVNVARGSVVDEEALIAALEGGAIAGAALDVFAREPDADPRLIALPNVLALPHIGSATTQTRAAMGALQRANIAAHLDGRALLTPVP